MLKAIAPLSQVLLTAAISPTTAFHFAANGLVFAHKLIVFAFDQQRYFCVLQSTLHREWAYVYSSTFGSKTLNYSPTDCFGTFPFPHDIPNFLDAIGKRYTEARLGVTSGRNEGLTKVYNRFHHPDELSDDIQKLRDLHIEMDHAVAAAYGWTDLELDHGFHETKQGVRFTISEPARREVLQRLLKLNHERYAQEVEQGLHEKKKSRKTSKVPKANQDQGLLFD